MTRWLKRLVALLLLGGVSTVLIRRRRDAPAALVATSPEWPPFEPATPSEPIVDWVLPVDGQCPDGYPIKANDNSHIFHVPSGRFYERTVAERCYATEAAAERDGYRRSKA